MFHPTYQSVYQPLRLLEDNAHWDRTLEEAFISDARKKSVIICCFISVLSTNWPVKILGNT